MKSHVSHLSAGRALVATSLSLLLTATAFAQNPNPASKDYSGNSSTSASGTRDTTVATTGTGTTNSGKLGFMDKRFVTKAADDGLAEVQIAQLAADRATNPEVKSYAQKLVTDHTAVNQELMGIASSKGVSLDKDDGQDRAYRALAKKSGADFDREFVEHMIDGHEKAIKMFEKASTEAKDADLRSFASKHVGHLKEHLTQAQSLRQSTMPTGRDDDNSGRGAIKDTSTPSAPETPSATTTPSKDSTKPKY